MSTNNAVVTIHESGFASISIKGEDRTYFSKCKQAKKKYGRKMQLEMYRTLELIASGYNTASKLSSKLMYITRLGMLYRLYSFEKAGIVKRIGTESSRGRPVIWECNIITKEPLKGEG